MVRHPVRFALLIGAITATAVSSARADDCCATCAPTTRTISCTQMVPETYTAKRTVYKVECKTEEYETTRCVRVPEKRERTITVVKRVPITTEQTRKVCKTVTEYCDKTVMKKTWQTVQETVTKKHLKSLGHYECREEVVHHMNLGGLFRHNDCGCNDSCGSCNTCAPACPETRTVKYWVFAPEYDCCPTTVCKKVCVETPTTCRVAVCKQVWSEEKVNVCSYKCVEEQQTITETVCVTHQEKVKATRQVRVCVPHEEEVTCTRMVPRTVTHEAACDTCSSSNCNTCKTCDSCGSRHGLLGGLFTGHGSSCCR